MFFLSWLTARGSGTGSVCLITLTDSPAEMSGQGRRRKLEKFINSFIYSLSATKHIPVRMDWSTRRVVDLMEMILISAGTLSPTSVHVTNTYTKAGPSLTFVSLVIYWFGSITVQRQSDCSVTAGWRRWGGRGAGFSTLDG